MKISALLFTVAGLVLPLAIAAAPPAAATNSAPAAATHACVGNDCPCQGVVSGKPPTKAPAPATRVGPAAAHADVYGWDIMTPGERRCYSLRMLSAKTPAERAKIRDEYHRLMAERARQQGVTLPEVPPAD